MTDTPRWYRSPLSKYWHRVIAVHDADPSGITIYSTACGRSWSPEIEGGETRNRRPAVAERCLHCDNENYGKKNRP